MKSGSTRLLSNDHASFKWDLRRAKGGYDSRYHAVLVNPSDPVDGRLLEGREDEDASNEVVGNSKEVRAVNVGCHVDKKNTWQLTGYAHIFNAVAIDGRPGQGDPLKLEFEASYVSLSDVHFGRMNQLRQESNKGIPRGEIRIASTGQAVARMASARRSQNAESKNECES